MTAVMKETLLNKELIEIHQSTATPPGKMLGLWTCTEPLDCQVWGRQLDTDGKSWLLALVNRGSKSHSITAVWHLLGWPTGSTATVSDIWTRRDLPNATGGAGISVQVPSHGAAALHVSLQ